jgi:hypothetical protein
MPYALCSNSACDYTIELHDRINGQPIETPNSCPSCKSRMISLCPNCGFLLIANSPKHICGFCKADIRLSLAKLQAVARSAWDFTSVSTDAIAGGSHRHLRDRLPKK